MGHQTPALPLLRIVPKRTESSQQTIEAVPAHGELPEPDLELDE
jgi:hypothetical protein